MTTLSPALAFVVAIQLPRVRGGALRMAGRGINARDDPSHPSNPSNPSNPSTPSGGGDSDDGGDGEDNSSSSTTRSSTTTSHTSTTTSLTSTTTSLTSTTTSLTTGHASSSLSSSGNNNVGSCGSGDSDSSDGSCTSSGSSLSTSARAGIAFGVLFGAIFLAILYCFCKRRTRKAKERAKNYVPGPMSAEVQRYVPPTSQATSPSSGQRDQPPVPRLDTNESGPLASDQVPDLPSSAVSSTTPLLSEATLRDSYPVSAWQRHSSFLPSQTSDITPGVRLPNPHDPYTAPARSVSLGSAVASATSSQTPISNGASTYTSTAASSSERRASALHTDLLLHQKQLELEHRKESLEARIENLDPPPSYNS
ncbi:hypothetical protein PAXRUDRAFT_831383 [Paxillus rubicundulus Ve08.2h10]|uniref:Uncharacterized protein n=1 Tax=Paxillus rubicundulus Ve08.2h10 TaxID=930991 RepID=A0A0D0DIG7_9AGAM|nr:hypothetical protein PAXRUDRAFT_831383 [Paxillus rubicundulus Ve08.2h10]